MTPKATMYMGVLRQNGWNLFYFLKVCVGENEFEIVRVYNQILKIKATL